MTPLNFRIAEQAALTVRAAATSFVENIVAHKFTAAAARIDHSIMWFGETMPRDAWRDRAQAALGNAPMEARLTGEILAGVLHRHALGAATMDGAVRPSHALTIFDFRRDDVWVSIGVLGGPDQRIERVIDLRRLKRCILERCATGPVHLP